MADLATVRKALLALHKTLLDAERRELERHRASSVRPTSCGP